MVAAQVKEIVDENMEPYVTKDVVGNVAPPSTHSAKLSTISCRLRHPAYACRHQALICTPDLDAPIIDACPETSDPARVHSSPAS